MLKLLENYVKTQQECFSQILNLGNIFENFDQKRQKTWFFFAQKFTFWAFFGTFCFNQIFKNIA